MERASDYALAAAASPLLELAAVLTAGFTWIYYAEWTTVPALVYSILLVAPLVSLVVGAMNWYALSRELSRAAHVGIMHGALEVVTLFASIAAIAMFVATRMSLPPTEALDARVLDQLIAAAAFAILGSLYGVVVFFFAVPLSWSEMRATYQKIIGS